MASVAEGEIMRSLAPKISTKWDHQKLVDVKGMLEQRSFIESAPNTKTQFVTQSSRVSK